MSLSLSMALGRKPGGLPFASHVFAADVAGYTAGNLPDLSPNGLVMTQPSGTLQPGFSSGVLTFDGGDYLQGDVAGFYDKFTGTITALEYIVSWVGKVGSLAAASYLWASGRNNSNTQSYVRVTVLTSGAVRLELANSTAGTETFATTTGLITEGQLHEITAAQSAGEVQIYVDGIARLEPAGVVTLAGSGAPNQFTLGARRGSSASSFLPSGSTVAAFEIQ